LATRIKADSNEALVTQLYWETYSRPPLHRELSYLAEFLSRQTNLYEGDAKAADKAKIDLCQLLICSNEFVYVD
jgi:hypothetical protein